MRSMKLLAAMAVVAALVAGPVMAQDTSGTASAQAADAGKGKTVKHHHKKHGKKGVSTAPVTEGTAAPAK